ncbi:biotin/lipoyl-binding protein [Propionicimonas paludicola]|uniref:Biotin/lipoyl-binding protein n=1 Tax=Propionicimonas paludicola TaxID=185243 RepID=A0A2A9CPE8_9ACTN|nr:HlyD family efflux transporter periplasmic adaptor subunit [Propionicimonas paludicola]PFG16026.1 biotin/lipoyl-binding protein [Propionicimonas paludicola]
MHQPTLVLALAATVALSGCGSSPELRVIGNVTDEQDVVAMPALAMPAVNLDAGFTRASGPIDPVSGRQAQTTSGVAARYSLGTTATLDELKVAVGDHVRTGQPLGSVDTAALAAQLTSAKADAAVASAQIGVLQAAIDSTYDAQHDLADARAKVSDAISQLESTRSKLLKTRPTLRHKLSQVEDGLAAVQQAIAALPPGMPVPPELIAKQQQLTAARSQLKAGLKKIDAALPKLAAGLKKARAGRTRLDNARAKLTDGRASLCDLLGLARIGADTMKVPVDLTSVQLDLAELVAPRAGVVVWVAQPGEQLAAGADAVAIRPDRPSTVTAWLSPSQLATVCLGDAADVHADWLAGDTTIAATLTRIAPSADYPPSSTGTDEIHLTRAVQVEFTATDQLPAGSPVELSIHGCHPAATLEMDR